MKKLKIKLNVSQEEQANRITTLLQCLYVAQNSTDGSSVNCVALWMY